MKFFNYRKLIVAIYREMIVEKYKQQSFWVLGAFIPTFAVARLIVRFFPETFVQVNGTHVHHFTYGIIILAVSGYLAIIRNGRAPFWLAIMYGIGLALAVDETGMWLHLTNQYYNDTSMDAVILVSAILINTVYFGSFWLRLTRLIFRQFKREQKIND